MNNKLDMKTASVAQGNIEKIRQLFPDAVTEVEKDGKTELAIDFDVLKQELSESLIDEGKERYQMTWPGKRQAIVLANTSTTDTLRPCKEESVDFDNTQNLYIEGDNLNVLKLLRETYLSKIKMIYIDPPYNTGNDSFVYNDCYSMDEEEFLKAGGYYDEDGNRVIDVKENKESNGKFHTDWLNMLYPRLRLARDLLTDDGVIFISIDDNEQANLKKICDEIFGESNFIGELVRMVMEGGKSDSQGIAIEHEYCLIYIKQDINGINQRIAGKQDHYNKKDNHFEERGYYYLKPLENGGLGYVPSLDYPIIGPDGKEIYPGGAHGDNGYRWVWGREKFNRALSLDMIEFSVSQKDSTKYKVYYKIYEKVDTDCMPIIKMLPFGSLYLDGFTNRQAIIEVKKIFGDRIFSYPKPTTFIKELIKIGANKDSIILDFFSGSATTAHAVMQLNAEDGGNRKFIMVQLPEKCDEKSEAYKAGYKNICEIGKERIRRAGTKIVEERAHLLSAVKSGAFEKGKPFAQFTNSESAKAAQAEIRKTLDIGFRVLKLDSSNMQDVYYNPAAVSQTLLDATIDNIKPDRTPLDLLFQVMLELGVPLSAKIEENAVNGKTYYAVNGNDMIACFDDAIDEEVITEIAKQQPLYAVFKDQSFASDSVAINNEQLFKTHSPATTIKVI
ncbi:TPA: site-specific DNA-methyltransferase [Candidatus Scatousia excrementigallinarum]|uniref:Site-specific DNA-methyltransferase n=1 Tax=Candidatus Scatousia excrementigallinarum TaxID=2840935 RepID=A0A9D1JMS3_9BACT|nr:site-specific DNA-methyltransferase [Candidatus Scatousia excrementigallinarum]